MTENEPLGPTKFAARSVAGHIIQGSAWMIAWRWGVRLIGLVSTIILARILTPTDFGIIAMAMVIVGLLDVLTDTNANLTLIRMKDLQRAHVDTAWTIQVMAGGLGGILTIALSPLALVLFDASWDVVLVIAFLSLRFFASALVNVGIVSFQLNLDFAKDFRFGMYEKTASFAVAIILALLLRSYWALAISIVATRCFSLGLSYWMSPYRPRFDLSRWREIWSFSAWLTILAIARFVAGKVDEFLIGNRLGSTAMGHYAVALDVSTSPTIELVQPAWRAIYPVYATVSHDEQKFKALFLQVFAVAVAVATPACFGISAVAFDFVPAVLGPQWVDASGLVAILAVSALPIILIEAVITVLNAYSQSRLSAAVMASSAVALIPACVTGFILGGMEGAAWGRLCALYGLLPICFIALRVCIVVSFTEYWNRVWRPAVAAGIMFLAVRYLAGTMVESGEFQRLAISVFVGVGVYGATMCALWFVAGRPAGIERWTLEKASSLFDWKRLPWSR